MRVLWFLGILVLLFLPLLLVEIFVGTESSGPGSGDEAVAPLENGIAKQVTGPGDDDGDDDPGATDSATASEGSGNPEDTETAEDVGKPVVERAPAEGWVLYGSVNGTTHLPAAEQRFELVTSVGAREVWTDDQGRFSFVVSREGFPASLKDAEGRVLAQWTRPPQERRLFLNVQQIAVRSPDQRLFSPWALAAERAEGSADQLDRVRLCMYGSTHVPAGYRLNMRLLGGGDKVLEARPVTLVEGESLLGEIEFIGRRLYSGFFRVALEWKHVAASDQHLQELDRFLPKDKGFVESKYRVYIGKRDEEKSQVIEIRDFYVPSLDTCQLSMDLITWLGAELREEPFVVAPEKMERLRQHPAFELVGGLRDGGKMQLERWREFVDVVLPEGWKPHHDTTRVPYPERHPRLYRNLPLMFAELSKFKKAESQRIYRKLGLPPHPNDWFSKEFDLETEYKKTRVQLRNFIRDARRRLPRA